jgi:hypothetical protein
MGLFRDGAVISKSPESIQDRLKLGTIGHSAGTRGFQESGRLKSNITITTHEISIYIAISVIIPGYTATGLG